MKLFLTKQERTGKGAGQEWTSGAEFGQIWLETPLRQPRARESPRLRSEFRSH